MKKILFAALLVAMPIMAQDADTQKQRGPRGQRPNAEQGPTAEQRQEMLQNAMAKFDKDGDGQLNPAEFAAMKRWAQKQMPKKGINPKMLEKYDTDKDGKLSKEEREAMKADRQANKGNREPLTDEQKAARQAKQLAKFDTNEDGYLNEEELAAAAKAAKAAKAKAMRKNGKGNKAEGSEQKGPKGKKGSKGKKGKKQQQKD